MPEQKYIGTKTIWQAYTATAATSTTTTTTTTTTATATAATTTTTPPQSLHRKILPDQSEQPPPQVEACASPVNHGTAGSQNQSDKAPGEETRTWGLG